METNSSFFEKNFLLSMRGRLMPRQNFWQDLQLL